MNYASLAPAKYTFQVRAINADGGARLKGILTIERREPAGTRVTLSVPL